MIRIDGAITRLWPVSEEDPSLTKVVNNTPGSLHESTHSQKRYNVNMGNNVFVRLSLVNVLLLINPLDPNLRLSALHRKPLLLQRFLRRATHCQRMLWGKRVPYCALNCHIRFVRDIRDEDESEDNEAGLDAPVQ